MLRTILAVFAASVALSLNAGTVRSSFNADWEFKWDDETAWKGATAPHDAARLRGFDSTAVGEGDQGYIPCGTVRYRKTFARPKGAGRFFLKFDGLYLNSKIYLNGECVGGRPNGYVGFEVPLENLKDANELVLVLDARTPNTRWYAGAGILRNVWLLEKTDFAVDPDAVFVSPRLEGEKAVVTVTAEGYEVVKPEGGRLVIEKPTLWSPETPHLYPIDVTVKDGIGRTDTVTKRFGVRSVVFTKDRGMLLNGRPYRIQGLCEHEDFGCLGTALNVPALKRKLVGMKAIGVNALRTVHHPFAPEFYDLCDEMGFLVMAELFDEWNVPKRQDIPSFAYHRFFTEWAEKDAADFIRRDRTHPSVIMWSIGNEIPEQTEEKHVKQGLEWTRRLVRTVKTHDATRPVTLGCNGPKAALEGGIFDAVDIVGLNYNTEWYEKLKGRYCLFGSETTASLCTRDAYLFSPKGDRLEIVPWKDHQEHAYAPRIFLGSVTMEGFLKVQRQCPWSAGEFSWCFTDYMGEPNHSDAWGRRWWPARSSYWGMMDLAGFPKDRYWLYKSVWSKTPTVHLAPDWNFAGFEGKKVPVMVYTNGEKAELFLNGRSLGVRTWKETDDLHLSWDVPYEAGVLEVKATMADGAVVTDRRETTGPAKGFRIARDFAADGTEFLRIDAVDAKGNRVLSFGKTVEVSLEGGELIGIDNGDPLSHESLVHPVHNLFHGSLLAVVKRTGGPLKVTVLNKSRDHGTLQTTETIR